MKKTYISPFLQAHEIEYNGLLALSTTENGGESLGETDFGEEGEYEICTQKKTNWDNTEW